MVILLLDFLGTDTILSNSKQNKHQKPSHLWLVSTRVQQHLKVRSVVAVAEAELLHEDLVLSVLPSLDDEPLHQLLLAQIHLEPLVGEGLRLGEQRPSRPACQEAGVFRHPVPVGVGGRCDLVVGD